MVGVETAQGVLGKLGFRFEPRGVHGAEDALQKMVHLEVFEDVASGGAVFVGEDAAGDALKAKELEQFAGARQERDAEKHVFGPERAIDLDGLRNKRGMVGAEDAGHGDLQAAADGAVDILHGRLGQAEMGGGVAMAAMNGGEVIEQGAIEIEEDGVVGTHEEKENENSGKGH